MRAQLLSPYERGTGLRTELLAPGNAHQVANRRRPCKVANCHVALPVLWPRRIPTTAYHTKSGKYPQSLAGKEACRSLQSNGISPRGHGPRCPGHKRLVGRRHGPRGRMPKPNISHPAPWHPLLVSVGAGSRGLLQPRAEGWTWKSSGRIGLGRRQVNRSDEWRRTFSCRFMCHEQCKQFAVGCYGSGQRVKRWRILGNPPSCYVCVRREFENSLYRLVWTHVAPAPPLSRDVVEHNTSDARGREAGPYPRWLSPHPPKAVPPRFSR